MTGNVWTEKCKLCSWIDQCDQTQCFHRKINKKAEWVFILTQPSKPRDEKYIYPHFSN